jgi:hypothetical protein
MWQFGESIRVINELITSLGLKGGISVAYPAAIPLQPLINKFGSQVGKTVGSFSLPSKLSIN